MVRLRGRQSGPVGGQALHSIGRSARRQADLAAEDQPDRCRGAPSAAGRAAVALPLDRLAHQPGRGADGSRVAPRRVAHARASTQDDDARPRGGHQFRGLVRHPQCAGVEQPAVAGQPARSACRHPGQLRQRCRGERRRSDLACDRADAAGQSRERRGRHRHATQADSRRLAGTGRAGHPIQDGVAIRRSLRDHRETRDRAAVARQRYVCLHASGWPQSDAHQAGARAARQVSAERRPIPPGHGQRRQPARGCRQRPALPARL